MFRCTAEVQVLGKEVVCPLIVVTSIVDAVPFRNLGERRPF